MRKLLGTGLLFSLLALRANASVPDFINGVKVGAPLPAHELTYLGAVPETKGKLLLIDFWATWCAPCREAMPELNRLHAEFGRRGLVIIGVTKEARDKVTAFLASQRIDYFIALDSGSALSAQLRIKALPYAILVDRQNHIVWRGQPSELKKDFLESLLAAATPAAAR